MLLSFFAPSSTSALRPLPLCAGTRDTLYEGPQARGEDPRQAVVDFHTQHYSADRMVLCLLGRQSLDELAALAGRMFSPITNKSLGKPSFSGEAAGHVLLMPSGFS